MNIIIEGPDNVGKSTLIRNIKNHFNDCVFQNLCYSNITGLKPHELIKYNKVLYNQMFHIMGNQPSNAGVICDRSHISEMVYSPLYRSYEGDYVLDIEKQFQNLKMWSDIYLITLIDKTENLIKRDDGLSHSIDEEKKNKELQLFKIAHDNSLIENKLFLSIHNLDANALSEKIIKWLGEKNV